MKITMMTAAAAWLALAGIAAGARGEPIDSGNPADLSKPPLDYADVANWAARAGAEGAAASVAPGASPRRTTRDADVFFVHPTTDLSRDHYTQDMADKTLQAWTDGSVIARQAGAFNRCCRIFAPYYHQATAGGGDATKKQKAFAYAYSDVLRAFDYYLAHDNGGRPFVLAGHSQGAAHVIQLLKDRVDGTPLQKRLVAAYVLGAALAEGDFGRTYKSIPPCATPKQTGCVVQWEAVLPSFDRAKSVGAAEKTYAAKWGDTAGHRFLCVNPLTFDRSKPSAPPSAAKGAVPGAPDATPMKPLIRGAVGAHCEDGLLVVDPAPALAMEPLGAASQSGAGSMHYHDVGLFYEDVRMNADDRVQAFLKLSDTRR